MQYFLSWLSMYAYFLFNKNLCALKNSHYKIIYIIFMSIQISQSQSANCSFYIFSFSVSLQFHVVWHCMFESLAHSLVMLCSTLWSFGSIQVNSHRTYLFFSHMAVKLHSSLSIHTRCQRHIKREPLQHTAFVANSFFTHVSEVLPQ